MSGAKNWTTGHFLLMETDEIDSCSKPFCAFQQRIGYSCAPILKILQRPVTAV